MNFTKIQGAGNDFVVVEASRINNNWPEMAAAMCDRHFGIGADGLLVVMPSVSADFEMHIFNHDGSEAEACGNGLRCFSGIDARTTNICKLANIMQICLMN